MLVITEGLVWLIIALPIISFLVNGVLVRAFIGSNSRYAGYITIAAIGASFVLSLIALATVMSDGPLDFETHHWIFIMLALYVVSLGETYVLKPKR